MAGWTSDEFTKVGGADELQVTSAALGRQAEQPADDLGRSVRGRPLRPLGQRAAAAWFRGTQVRHEGHISAGGVDRDVTFTDADHAIDDEIDAAYQSKYQRYPQNITDSVKTSGARSTTMRLLPR